MKIKKKHDESNFKTNPFHVEVISNQKLTW